jgi:hypothetical protein
LAAEHGVAHRCVDQCHVEAGRLRDVPLTLDSHVTHTIGTYARRGRRDPRPHLRRVALPHLGSGRRAPRPHGTYVAALGRPRVSDSIVRTSC